jgi:hypothetical protein
MSPKARLALVRLALGPELVRREKGSAPPVDEERRAEATIAALAAQWLVARKDDEGKNPREPPPRSRRVD